MLTISIRGLAKSTTETSLTSLFEKYGSVHSVKLVKDLFSGDCKGFAEVKMEGHEARVAITALNFKEIDGSTLRMDANSTGKKKNNRGKR